MYGVAKSLHQVPQGKLPPGSTPVGSTKDILDIKWVWIETALADGTTITPQQKDAFTITLLTGQNATGKTDCNSFFSEYALGSDGVLSFGPIGSTKMACEGSQEAVFTDAISKVSHYTFNKDGNLVLILADGAGSMYFQKQELFTIKVGETQTARGISITVNSFVQDSRCPIDVTCIQAGAVTVNVTMKGLEDFVTRNVSSGENPFIFDGSMISIVDVQPAPKANQVISPEDYEITFRVE